MFCSIKNMQKGFKFQKNIYHHYSTKLNVKKKLPFIRNQDFAMYLENYVKENPSKKVLIVWGQKSISKTTDILEKAKDWKKEGYTIIDINLKGITTDQKEFIDIFEDEIYKVLKEKGFDLQLIENLFKSSYFSIEKRFRNTEVKKYLKKTCLFSNIFTLGYKLPFYDYDRISDGLNVLFQLMDAIKDRDIKGITIILNSIENLDKIQSLQNHGFFQRLWIQWKNISIQEIKPILIIRDIENLKYFKSCGNDALKYFFDFYQQRKEQGFKVPVITEVSEFLWDRLKKIHINESFDFYRVLPFTKEEMYDILVLAKHPNVKEQIFNEDDFQFVWSQTQGNKGILISLYDNKNNEESITVSMVNQNQKFYLFLKGVIYDQSNGNDESENRIKLLKKLRENDYHLCVDDPQNDKILFYFINHNILFLKNQIIIPHSKPMENAINMYLSFYHLEKK